MPDWKPNPSGILVPDGPSTFGPRAPVMPAVKKASKQFWLRDPRRRVTSGTVAPPGVTDLGPWELHNLESIFSGAAKNLSACCSASPFCVSSGTLIAMDRSNAEPRNSSAARAMKPMSQPIVSPVHLHSTTGLYRTTHARLGWNGLWNARSRRPTICPA